MTVVLVICLILTYLVIGGALSAVTCALVGDDELGVGITIAWPVFLIVTICAVVVLGTKFIGEKIVAFILQCFKITTNSQEEES